MPSIYGQNCGLKTWALSWHHLHRENAKEFLNDRIVLSQLTLFVFYKRVNGKPDFQANDAFSAPSDCFINLSSFLSTIN